MFNPNPYLPSFPMPYQLPQTNGLLFVNGRESAMQYQLPPNSKQILMDRNSPRFYLVETDASGQKQVQAYDFAKADELATEYATKADLMELNSNYESLAKRIEQLASPVTSADADVANAEPAGSAEPSAASIGLRANHARAAVPVV